MTVFVSPDHAVFARPTVPISGDPQESAQSARGVRPEHLISTLKQPCKIEPGRTQQGASRAAGHALEGTTELADEARRRGREELIGGTAERPKDSGEGTPKHLTWLATYFAQGMVLA